MVKIWENPISGSFFWGFFGPLTPMITLNHGYLVLFCSPGVVWHIRNFEMVWGHIKQKLLGVGRIPSFWEMAKIGRFEDFQAINAPPDPAEHFQHDIYTYIYVYILYIYNIYYIYIIIPKQKVEKKSRKILAPRSKKSISKSFQ